MFARTFTLIWSKTQRHAVSCSIERKRISGSFLEEQFPGAVCSFDDRLDERDTQLPFFEFEDAVNRAARWGRYRVFQQRWMVSRL